MTSLRAHLRQPGSHGRLPFHPDCPVCRQERLAGQLPANAIVAHRTLAALTAGVLAVSAGAPSLAVAAPDQQQSGTPEPAGSNDTARHPDSLSGKPGNPPPDSATAPPNDSDTAPVEGEPAKDPAANQDDQQQQKPPQRQTTPVTAPPTAAPAPATPVNPATPTIPPAPAAALPAPPSQAPQATLRPPAPGQHRRHPRRTTQIAEPLGTSRPEIQTSLPALQAQADTPMVEPSTPARRTAPRHDTGARAAAHGGRVHVVVADESLWSVARDQLGRGASNTDIAREVHRLWELNAKEIATGNPDLLMVGTKLKLA